MRRWKTSVRALLMFGVGIAQTPNAAVTPVVERVGGKLACLCGGCRNTVANCPMLGCHYATPAREKINQLAAEGKSDDEIIQAFVKETGIQALAVPPAQGFNRLMWIMPWVMVGLGLVAIALFIRAYSGRRATAGPNAAPGIDPAVLDRYRENIEKDMSKLD